MGNCTNIYFIFYKYLGAHYLWEKLPTIEKSTSDHPNIMCQSAFDKS